MTPLSTPFSQWSKNAICSATIAVEYERVNQSSRKSNFLLVVGVVKYASLLPSWWKGAGWVVQATVQSGTVTLLTSGLMNTRPLGPKIAPGPEPLSGQARP